MKISLLTLLTLPTLSLSLALHKPTSTTTTETTTERTTDTDTARPFLPSGFFLPGEPTTQPTYVSEHTGTSCTSKLTPFSVRVASTWGPVSMDWPDPVSEAGWPFKKGPHIRPTGRKGGDKKKKGGNKTKSGEDGDF